MIKNLQVLCIFGIFLSSVFFVFSLQEGGEIAFYLCANCVILIAFLCIAIYKLNKDEKQRLAKRQAAKELTAQQQLTLKQVTMDTLGHLLLTILVMCGVLVLIILFAGMFFKGMS